MKDKKESADFKPYVTFLTGRSKTNFCLSNNKTQLSYIQEFFLLISFLGSKALVISVEGRDGSHETSRQKPKYTNTAHATDSGF